MAESLSVAILGTKKKADLPAELFGVQTNIPLIHQVVVAQLAAARQGTHATKTRGDVRGGGAKPWRQKGTGRARQGSRRAPQWTGGGVVHGPQPRSYAQRTPKKMVAAALQALESIAGKRVLVVLTRDEEIAWLSLRNVASVHLITPDQLNAYDAVVADDVVFSTAALDAFVAGPAKGKSVKAVATESEVATQLERSDKETEK